MESKRQQKFSRVIQKELGDLFQREGYSFQGNTIVTITTVRASPDLSLARVYLSIYNATNTEQALNNIKAHSKEIRYKLGVKIKNIARIVPNLEFFLDDTQTYAKRIDDIFDQIHKSDEEQREGEKEQ